MFLWLICNLISVCAFSQTIRFVKPTMTGTGDGSSWENASETIQTMINASASGDQVWVAAGNYPLTATLQMKQGVHLFGGFQGNETSVNERKKSDLDGNGTTEKWEFTYATVLDGKNERRVLTQENEFSIETICDGVTITQGNSTPIYYGGGAFIRKNGKLINCTITENVTTDDANSDMGTYGGGIYLWEGTVSQCFISNNKATGKYATGGGIANTGGIVTDCIIKENEVISTEYVSCGGGIDLYQGTVTNSSIINNKSVSSDNEHAAYGGGIFISCDPEGGIIECTSYISNCTISRNEASNSNRAEGGGVCCDFATPLKMNDCIIENNSAISEDVSCGGGIRGGGHTGTLDDIIAGCEVNRCIIKDNTVKTTTNYGSGGGSFDCLLTNCLVLNNHADQAGGSYGSKIVNCTYVGNTASQWGGGIELSAFGCRVSNCIFWQNEAPNGTQIYPPLEPGYDIIVSNCAIQDGYTGPESMVKNIIELTQDNATGGPLFVDPTVGNFQLQSGSPCIDAGNNALLSHSDTLDLSKLPRISKGIVDIGAYEYQTQGIAEIDQTRNLIFIYPNPVATELYVKYDSQETTNYMIANVNGQLMMQGKLHDGTILNVQSLTKGIYFFKISGKENVTVKFVKN